MAFFEGFNHTGRALIQLGSNPAVQVFAIAFVAVIAMVPLNISENLIAFAEAATVFLMIVACGLSAGKDRIASKLKVKMAKISEDEQPALADIAKPVHTKQASIEIEKAKATRKCTKAKKKETTNEVQKEKQIEEVAEPHAQHIGFEGESEDALAVSNVHIEEDTCLPIRTKQAREGDRLHKKLSDGAELSKEEQQKLAQKDAIAAELAELHRRHEAGETGEAEALAVAANAEFGPVPPVDSALDVSLDMQVAPTLVTEEVNTCSLVQELDCTSEPVCEVTQPTEALPEPFAKTADPRLQPCPTGITMSEERAQKLASRPNVCWEWIAYGVCPRGVTCKWQHPPVCAAAALSTPLSAAATEWQHPSVYVAAEPTLKITSTPLSTAAAEWQHPSMYAATGTAVTIASAPLSKSASAYYPPGILKASL